MEKYTQMTKLLARLGLVLVLLLASVGLVFAQANNQEQPIEGMLDNILYYPLYAIRGVPDAPSSNPNSVVNRLYLKANSPCMRSGAGGYCLEKWVIGDYNSKITDVAALPAISNAIGYLYKQPPASAQVYVADIIKNINPAQPAYAQGIGFASLDPILSIWKLFRNVANFLMVIVFILVGFAIMFRAKLGAQTVANIQNSLPQLVITLLLVNFSYAIAGLMIDAMYIVMYFIVNLFKTELLKPAGFVGEHGITDESTAIETIVFGRNFIDNTLNWILPASGSAASAFGEVVSDLAGGGWALDLILGGMTSIIIALILTVVVLMNAFKVFFMLLSSYIQFVIEVLFAPITLLMNAYPGSQTFTKWLKRLAARLAVFPVIVLMLLLLFAFVGGTDKSQTGFTGETGSGFTPPQLNFSTEAFPGIVALGIILAMPTVAERVQKMFGVDDGDGGGMMGAFAGGGLGALGGALLNNPAAKMLGGLGGAYKGAILSSALTGAQSANTPMGAIRGAIMGAGRGAYNPAGVSLQNWYRKQASSQSQELYWKKQAGLIKDGSTEFKAEQEKIQKVAARGEKPMGYSDAGRYISGKIKGWKSGGKDASRGSGTNPGTGQS